ncbi:MAG: glycosyltransferase family 87 protein [Pseudomonadota bacterium]
MRQRYLQLAWINALTVVIIVGAFVSVGIDVPGQATCVTRFVDFHAIWGAARLALEGNPIAAFDRETLERAYRACEAINMYWLYPAPMAVILTPVGALPFLPAYIGFQLLSLGLLSLAVRSYFQRELTALVAIVFAPAWLPALLVGQFTILWCAGLLAAITAMRHGRHVLAGIFIGLLTLKPTLGLLIPLVLLADRRYATVAVAIVTTAMLHIGATSFYGFEYFARWLEASALHGTSAAQFSSGNNTMASVAAFASQLGVPAQLSLYANVGLLLAVAAIVFVVWRRYGAQSDAACAVLCAAIPLSTPYLWHYDAGFSALVAMFLYRSRREALCTFDWIVLGIIWAGPGITLWNTYFFHLSWVYPTIFVPPVLLLAFAFALWQLRTRQTAIET